MRPAENHYGVNHKLIFVNQAVIGKQVDDGPTPQYGHILAGRFFDRSYLFREYDLLD